MPEVTIPLAKLVEDFSLYPRRHVDDSHVANLAGALAAGEELPPPMIDSKYRIIDGVHRSRAHRKHYGADAEIKVIQKRFSSETDALKEAIRLNATHGRKLDEADRTRSILLLQEGGVETKEIAAVLSTTEERVQKLSVRVVMVDGSPMPAKRTQWPRKGESPKTMTAKQYTVAKSSSGWHVLQTVRQLRRELTGDVLDLDDQTLISELAGLGEDIAALDLEVAATA